ncbi:unnamed protein product [Caenorhabditis angaria]|uniref:[histone H3]-trimethyl-L-lysine(4) demethylase n=1 Tax=Caenorhabditis angaria TaxID=860376 RepID=A0A9P1N1H3_9PELO|nr:unnamed protein product [Caenorhabditis angaria]
MRGRRSFQENATKPRKSAAKPEKRMEMYDEFYLNFEPPPLAKIYTPTAEEFLDPIKYVEKIRAEAEQFGVVKIIPPSTFKPPFVIDRETFNFLEAMVKEKHTFVERVINFNRMSGIPYELPYDKDGKVIDVYRLHRIVQNMGGCYKVNHDEKWRDVAKEMIPVEKSAKLLTAGFVKMIQKHYNNFIEPFNRNLKEKESRCDDSDDDDETEELKHKYQHHHGTMRTEKEDDDVEYVDDEEAEECPPSMQGGGRRRGKKKTEAPQRQSRMMAGGVKKQANLPTKKRVIKKRASSSSDEDPMDTVFCISCTGGMDEDLLLLCDIEGCQNGRHTYCCDPPLEEVPQGEWRCPKCIEAEDSKIGLDWGFYDNDVEYNLNTFAEFANDFKCKYFGVDAPMSVDRLEVEKEFWKNVQSPISVSVKYGADLITSKMGSGFPRKEDKFHGPESRIRQQYANHAWNLNNLPVLRESVLSHINTGISGMMVPWVYVGMCFSTFCWHTEDHWTYSINYNHWGERKIWYGIGGDDATKFEDAVRKIAPGLTGRQRDLFHHMTTAANPHLLRNFGVPIYKVEQNAGEFVITFPRAYHAGFNEGLNFAEAVNFAPIDWLQKGRLCMEEYSNVRRFSVFSHDELVFKMVEARDRLGISMSLATLDELLEIQRREQKMREMVVKMGVEESEKVIFENLQDDQRTCRYCRTTLFVSAITCKHGRSVCLHHFDRICKKCTIDQCVMQFRYDLDELPIFIDQLETRTTEYHSWRSQSDLILHEYEKPEMSKIDELIDTAKSKHYPFTAHMQTLLAIRENYEKVTTKAKILLNGKVRTRTGTRNQRADTRFDVEGVRRFIEEIQEMPIEMTSWVEKLEELYQKVENWRKRTAEVIETQVKLEGENNSEEVKVFAVKPLNCEDFEAIIEEGEEFDIKLDEIGMLKKIIDLKKWESRVEVLISWKPSNLMELEEEYEYSKRWTTDEVLSLIRDGSKLAMQKMEKLQKLQNMLKMAHVHDSDAEVFMKNPTISNLAENWKSIRESDWYTGKYIDKMRTEMLAVQQITQQIDKICQIPEDSPKKSENPQNLSEKLEFLSKNAPLKFADIVELSALFGDSRILSESLEAEKLAELKSKMEKFTQKIGALFKKNEFFSIFEILSEREDFPQLIEGQTLPKYSRCSTSSACDEWNEITEFDTIEQLMQHQSTMRDSRQNLIANLQQKNDARGLETCICLNSDPTSASLDQQKIVICLMCRAKYHVSCVEWSDFLQNLPEGSYLCIRCLKGRRPILEDVQLACSDAPDNCFEMNLVRCLMSESREISRNLLSSESEQTLLDFLSCEILNLNCLPKVGELIRRFYGKILEFQLENCRLLRNRTTPLQMPSAIFVSRNASTSRRGKRGSGQIGKDIARKIKRRSGQKGGGDITAACSAEKCLQPYGQVGWVQCDPPGCNRWFHFVCVGLTHEEIDSIENYTCQRCSNGGGSTGSPLSSSSD